MKKKTQKKKAKPNKVSPRLNKLLEKLTQLFGVQMYDRIFTICRQEKKSDSGQTAAEIEIHEDYQRIYIYFYPCFFRASLMRQRQYVLHEFCHYLTTDLLWCANHLRDDKLVTYEQIRIASEKDTSRAMNLIECLMLGDAKVEANAYAQFARKKAK